MKAIYDFMMKHSKLTLTLLAVVIFFSVIIIIVDFSISSDVSNFFPKDSKVTIDLKRINEKYDGTSTILLAIISDNILSKDNLRKTYELTGEISKLQNVNYISSFAPDKIIKSLVFIPITSKNLDTTYNDLVAYIKANNRDLYKKNAGLITIVLKSESNSNYTIEKIIKLVKKYGFQYHMTGNSVINYYIFKYLGSIFSVTMPLVIIILLGTFTLILKSFKAAVISILPSVLAMIVLIAIIFLLGDSLSLVTVIVPMFVMIIGSAQGMHFVSHFMHNKKRFKNDDVKNIRETMKMLAVPIFLTAITTMAGFLSLLTSQLDGLRQVGYYSAIGIGISAFFTLTLLSVILDKLKIPYKESKSTGIFILKFFHMTKKYKKTTIAFFIISAIAFSILIPKIKVISDEMVFFKSDTAIVKDAAYFNDSFGFSHILFYDYRTNSNDVMDNVKIEKQVLAFEKELSKIKNVTYVMSFYDIKKKIVSSVPQSFMKDFVLRRMIDGGIVPVDQWVYKNKDLKILVKMSKVEPETFDKLIALSNSNRVLTGADYIFYLLNKNVVRDQIISLIFALIFVWILLLIFDRSFLISFISLIPIIYTLIVFFAFLYLSGFNLNIVIAIIASIVVGIGIDYSIHIVGGYKYYGDIDKTIDSVGIPVIANSLGLTLGLSPMIISPLRIHSDFAISIGFAMIVSSFSSMSLLPILIEHLKLRRKNVSKIDK